MRWVLAAVICGLAAGSAQCQELPLSAVKQPIGDGGQAWDVILTSRADTLDIRHLELNRGACHARMDGRNGYPNPIRFGQQIVMRMFDCDPIEILVQADQGTAVIEMPE